MISQGPGCMFDWMRQRWLSRPSVQFASRCHVCQLNLRDTLAFPGQAQGMFKGQTLTPFELKLRIQLTGLAST